MLERRQFLSCLGIGSYALLRNPLLAAQPATSGKALKRTNQLFEPIPASTADQLVLAKGFRYDVVCKWRDPLGTSGPYGPEQVGSDNDYISYLPIDARSGGKNCEEGLLWVNHESVTPLFVSNYKASNGPKTREQIQREKLAVGGSTLHIRKTNGRWQVLPGSPFNKRLCALYPSIAFSGPAASQLGTASGTLANCSGGTTPWHTVLTCEENFDEMNPTSRGLAWGTYDDTAIIEEHYGWVVEVDPFGELPPVKHTSLGRFAHENAAMRVGPTGKLVVYMGDDRANQFIYKFVSSRALPVQQNRAAMRQVLNQGTLYVADLKSKRWIPLDLKRTKALREAGFKSQADILINTRAAAAAAGGTPVDRPEDCEVHPQDGSVYISLTNNAEKKNHFGTILRIVEDSDSAEAETFSFEVFLAGGNASGLACPDNLTFDRHHNLWVTCDVSTDKLNRGKYKIFGNNGLFMVPTSGPNQGVAFQFAAGPVEAELTGPCFTPDGKTLFISVQHPGQHSVNHEQPTSTWPLGPGNLPHSAVVAIEGF